MNADRSDCLHLAACKRLHKLAERAWQGCPVPCLHYINRPISPPSEYFDVGTFNRVAGRK